MTAILRLVPIRKRAERDLWFLMTEVLGCHFLSPTLHKGWCAWIDEPYSEPIRVFLAPREHAKSTIFTRGKTVQRILRNPDETNLLAHLKARAAEKLLLPIKEAFEKNQKLRDICPDICWEKHEYEGTIWRNDQIVLKRSVSRPEPTIGTMGMESSMVMMHFTHISGDDIVTDENVSSADMMMRTFEWFQTWQGLQDRTAPRTTIDLTGTRWRHNDTYGEILDPLGPYKGSVRYLSIDVYDKAGAPIWKEHPVYGKKDELERIEKLMGSFLFGANFRNSPTPKGTAVFNLDDVDVFDPTWEGSGSNRKLVLPTDPRPDGSIPNYNFYAAIDPNTSQNTANDPAVVTTAAVDDRNHMWICRMDRGNPSPLVLIEWIMHHARQRDLKLIVIEGVQYQVTLSFWLKYHAVDQNVPLRIHTVTKRSKGHYDRILRIQEWSESRRLHVPNDPMFTPLLDEMKVYTEATKREDCLDTLADIVEFARAPEPLSLPKEKPPRNEMTLDMVMGRMNHGQGRAVPLLSRSRTGAGFGLPRRLTGA